MTDPAVCEELKKLDIVVAKLDAPDQTVFEAVNRPVSAKLKFDEILAGLKRFRREYRGRLCLQLMFVAANRAAAAALAPLAVEIQPDEVQLNTLLRLCGVEPLLIAAIEARAAVCAVTTQDRGCISLRGDEARSKGDR